MRVFARRLFRINVPNTLTLLNGVSGFASVIASAQGFFEAAALLILAGVFFDYLDGKAARLFNQESALGAELDSLSDVVTFGVAPAVLVALLSPGYFSLLAGGLFVLSAALRLARFNVQQVKGVFFGLPTTASGLLLPALVLFEAPLIVFPWFLLALAFLMNAPIKVPKPL
jgi:CDP-diacylglycerol---serine O-phosphatidyltransferase